MDCLIKTIDPHLMIFAFSATMQLKIHSFDRSLAANHLRPLLDLKRKIKRENYLFK